mgnify:CR=1 FL=1
MTYAFNNFAYGTLAEDILAGDTQVKIDPSRNLPGAGKFMLVLWDMEVFPNPADDPNTEIVEAEYTGADDIYNIGRGKESTIAVAHSAGDEAALHLTAGVLNAERLVLGSATGLTLSDGELSVTTGYSIPQNTDISNWNTAYGWGDHSGLYDPAGTATSEINSHELTYDHILLHDPVTLGVANGLSLDGQELSLLTTASPEFVGLTLSNPAGGALLNLVSAATDVSGFAYFESNRYANIQVRGLSNVSDHCGTLALGKARGAIGSPTDVVSGDILAQFLAQGYYSDSWRLSAGFQVVAEGTLGVDESVGVPSRLELRTTKEGANSWREQLRISSTGDITCWNNTEDNPVFYFSGYNSTEGNNQIGRLESHYYDGGSSNNIVLGAGSTGSPNIRLQVDSTTAHIGLNVGGTSLSSFTLRRDGSGDAYIQLRGANAQSGVDATEQAVALMSSTGLTLSTEKGGIVIAPFTEALRCNTSLGLNTDPVTQLHLRTTNGGAVGPTILLQNVSSTTGTAAHIDFTSFEDTTDAWRGPRISFIRTNRGASREAELAFSTYDRAAGDGALVEWVRIAARGNVGFGTTNPSERIHCTAKIRADTAFNVNGTDGVSDSGAGVPTALTVAGGIVTAVTKNDWLDQDVRTTATPTFVGITSALGRINARPTSSTVVVEAIRFGRATRDIRFHSLYQSCNSGSNSYLEFRIHDGGADPFLTQNTVLTLYGATPEARVSGLCRATGNVRADGLFNVNGTDGITVTDTVITALQDNAGQLQYKSKTITFTGGIRTATGAESGWTDVPSA